MCTENISPAIIACSTATVDCSTAGCVMLLYQSRAVTMLLC